jgi:hypothetical protein
MLDLRGIAIQMDKSFTVRAVLLSLFCFSGVRLPAANYFVDVFYNRYSPNSLQIA